MKAAKVKPRESAVASVEFKQVIKKYSEQAIILKGIDLVVGDGEFLVLVGPSGCGKSTLLRSLAGLEKIDGGSILIGGAEVSRLAPKDRDIAMVFQSYALYPHMTSRENMAFGLSVRKVPPAEIKKRVEEAAEILGITALLDRLPKEMSGGQRQRVAMGRAVVRDPKVFLFDEPLSNLDAALRTQMRVELKKLHERLKTTIIYVTHDQVEAMTLADRIVVLNQGIIQQVGTPAALYDRPANTFVARFIGTPSMNMFELSATEKGEETLLSSEAARFRVAATGLPARVIAGVRPQDLFPASEENAAIEGIVEIVEALGAESLIHLTLPENRTATVSLSAEKGRALTAGKRAFFSAAPATLHLFDAATGKRIDLDRGDA